MTCTPSFWAGRKLEFRRFSKRSDKLVFPKRPTGAHMALDVTRRQFGVGLAGLGLAGALQAAPSYRGPNVILIRYGGGVRRREIIEPGRSLSPFLDKVLRPRGVLFPKLEIEPADGIVTSHAQGTLYLLTGRYDRYEDVSGKFLRERFVPKAPTLFEALRAAFPGVQSHEALIVNGEDRRDEDFFTYSADPHFGVRYRSSVLSLNQFKAWRLRGQISAGEFEGQALIDATANLDGMDALDTSEAAAKTPPIDRFWRDWRQQYGDTGLKNPRGDRLLTHLALSAMERWSPKLMLVNYQDPDYVHWGTASHYARAIKIIDDGIAELFAASEKLDAYRGRTVFVIAPDCGRDDNPLLQIPYQHHFNSRAAHEVFALFAGPGIAKGKVVDRKVSQIAVAATIGALMGFPMPNSDAPPLTEVFA
jgi:hypothetical protein